MVKWCSAGACKNNHYMKKEDGTQQYSFYRFPSHLKESVRREKWAKACNRLDPVTKKAWAPRHEAKAVYLCSAHFISGKKSDDPLHPDFVPSLFSFTSDAERTRALKNLERYERSQNGWNQGFYINTGEQAAAALLNPHQSSVSEEEEHADIKTEHADIKTEHADIKTEPGFIEVKIEEPDDDVASLHQQIQSLNLECQTLREKVCELESELKRRSLDALQFDDDKMKFFTGLPNLKTFMLVLSYVSSVFPNTAFQSLMPTQELLLTLMKLRLNLSDEFLGYFFGVDRSTVSRIFQSWINVMASRLHPLILWPERKELRGSLPVCFQTFFKKCISIIDYFEVFIEPASDLKIRTQTWSKNKQNNTMKFLISATPQGNISFVSKAWAGHVTDQHLTEQSLFLEKLQPGDLVLADRGFINEDSVGLYCAELITPLFSRMMPHLVKKEIESAPEISDVRTHVERVIGMLRQKYTILSSTLPTGRIRIKQNGRVDDNIIDNIVLTCCALHNMSESSKL